MPRVSNPLTESDLVASPSEPHLALMTVADQFPVFKGIPTGSIMAIVVDPKDPVRGIFPIAIVRVGPKRLEFQCPCGQKNCTRRVVFNASWSGVHPRGTPEISTKR